MHGTKAGRGAGRGLATHARATAASKLGEGAVGALTTPLPPTLRTSPRRQALSLLRTVDTTRYYEEAHL